MTVKLSNVSDIRKMVLAGNSTFTIQSVKTGKRFTFKVNAPMKDNRRDYASTLFFVSLMNGSDNNNDFAYLGTIKTGVNGIRFDHGRKSSVAATADSTVAFGWFAKLLNAAGTVSTVEVYPSNNCSRCGRKLTVPSSVAAYLGPECAGRFEALAA